MVLLLACSGFFSACETSLLSISRIQLKRMRDEFPKRFERIQFLLNRPTALVATIMIGNEFANVLMSALMADFYDRHFDSVATVTMVNLCTILPLIIIFGEITPRILAIKANMTTANFVLPVVWIAYKVTLPIRFFIELIVNNVIKMLPFRHGEIKPLPEEDFLLMIEDSKSKGAIHAKEKELIENVFELDDDTASDLLKPLNSITTVYADEKVSSLLPVIRSHYTPRIPVLGNTPNHVVGVIHIKDVLGHANREILEVKAKHLMREPMVVPPSISVEVLFKRMRQFRNHLAIVAKDGDAENALGVITMEDVLNQLFGELWK